MPWSVSKNESKCSASKPWAVINDDNDNVEGCHATESAAEDQQAALYANTEEESKSMAAPKFRDDLVRMIPFEHNPQWPSEMVMRMAEDGNTLVGYAAVFDRWTEINSWEGRFKERISKGAFRKTIRENRNGIKVLFNHGMDPSIGDKPLGKPKTMKEDSRGLYVEVPLDDTSYNADLKASLRSGALDGMSFRMNVIRDEWDDLEEDVPERTIKEIRMFEFGPVTFPAYEATEAGVRAHAPEAFAAFRAGLKEGRNVVEEAREARIGSAASYVYTPSSWAGWQPHSITSNGVTLYVRSTDGMAPGDDGNPDPNVETPENPVTAPQQSPDPAADDNPPVAAPDAAAGDDTDAEPVDPANVSDDQEVVVTELESESVTLASPDESDDDSEVDAADHPSSTEDAPVETPSDDAPSDSAHPSTEQDPPQRLKPWRMTLRLDEINNVVDKAEFVDSKRYDHLLTKE